MKRLLSVILSLLFFVPLCACSSNSGSQKYTKSFLDLFDTASFVTAYDASQKAFDSHYAMFYNELETYAKLYDIYNDYDGIVNLKYLNEHAAVSPVRVDEKIMDLLAFGKEAYEMSGGRVNICMGAVLSVWHDEREKAAENPENTELPDTNLLREKAEHTDINSLVLDSENSTVYFSDPEMKLDAGAIAKGYAAEKICAYIETSGIWQSAVISLGGNIKTVGVKDKTGSPFVIGIENPDSEGDYVAKVGACNGESVVTSGDYQRYYTVDGVKYCHIIDPNTLMPAEYVSSVTVISEDSAYADMLSTDLFIMSVEDGITLVNRLENTQAVWVDKNGKKFFSSGFEKYAVE